MRDIASRRECFCSRAHPAVLLITCEETVKTERRKIEGNLEVSEPLQLYSTVTGNLTVKSGGSLFLYGTCAGDLAVEKGGEATIYGTVSGNLDNRGTVKHFGTIGGSVLPGDGTFENHADAVVRGAVRS
jgi:hypothetical protein